MNKLFITGGNGDIGSSISNIFEKNGYEVIRPSSVDLDLSNRNEIEKYLEHINDISVFIHCAGVNYPKSFLKIDDFELKEVMTFIIYIDSFFLVNKIQMLYDHFLLFHYYNV